MVNDDWYAKSLARSAALPIGKPRGNPNKKSAAQIRKQRTVGKLSKDIREKLMALQNGKCPCCGRQLGKNPHLDHKMPLCLGGTNTDDNMQLLRSTCNLQKSGSHPDVFNDRRERQKAYWKSRGLPWR